MPTAVKIRRLPVLDNTSKASSKGEHGGSIADASPRQQQPENFAKPGSVAKLNGQPVAVVGLADDDSVSSGGSEEHDEQYWLKRFDYLLEGKVEEDWAKKEAKRHRVGAAKVARKAGSSDVVDDEEDEDDDVDVSKPSAKKVRADAGHSNVDMWETRYAELVRYKAQKGDCNVPSKYPANKSLGYWVDRQRRKYQYSLSGQKAYPQVKFERLNDLGFQWWTSGSGKVTGIKSAAKQPPRTTDPGTKSGAKRHKGKTGSGTKNADKWQQRYEELARFKSQHGHFNVYWDCPLRSFVDRQRRSYRMYMEGKKKSYPKEKMEKLNALGFDWKYKPAFSHPEGAAAAAAATATALTSKRPRSISDADISEYSSEKKIKPNLEEDDKAGKTGEVEMEKKPSAKDSAATSENGYADDDDDEKDSVSSESSQGSEVESEGAEYDIDKEETWEDRFEELKQFKARYGHCNVLQGCDDFPGLYNWVEEQRQHYQLNQHNMQYIGNIEKLKSIGFHFYLRKDVESLVHPHEVPEPADEVTDVAAVAGKEEEDASSASQPMSKRSSRRSRSRVAASLTDEEWQLRISELLRYSSQYGNCSVPIMDGGKAVPLGLWLKEMRRQYWLYMEERPSFLNDEKIALLNDVGVDWNAI